MTEQLVAERRDTPRRRRLGEVLVLRGLVAQDDVASALMEQRRSRRRLGQILLARGTISSSDLHSALAEQAGGGLESEHGFGTGLRGAIEGSADRRNDVSVASEGVLVGRPLGELLINRGWVEHGDVSGALAEQGRTGRPLGEILVDRGAVSPPELSRALAEQAKGSPDAERGFGTGLRKRLT
ncbi:MAG: hypothetical protein WD805_02700 [Gaiellaceae bacterium]